MNWLILLLVLLAVAAVTAVLWQTIPKLRCPYCDSHQNTLIDKSVVRTQQKQIMVGEGGAWTLETVFRKKYKCQSCAELWHVEEPE